MDIVCLNLKYKKYVDNIPAEKEKEEENPRFFNQKENPRRKKDSSAQKGQKKGPPYGLISCCQNKTAWKKKTNFPTFWDREEKSGRIRSFWNL